MPTFDDTTPEQARERVSAPAFLAANRLYVGAVTPDAPDPDPDHWQDGDGYAGPLPGALDANRTVYMEALQAAFVVEDCLTDIRDRKTAGLLAKPPHWSFVPDRDADGQPDAGADPDATPDPAEAEAEAVTQAMRAWAVTAGGGRKTFEGVLKEWADEMSIARRSYLRAFVPSGRMSAPTGPDGEPVPGAAPALAVSSAEEALRHIYLARVGPDQAALYTDESVMMELGVTTFEATPDGEPTADGAAPGATVELTYLDGAGEGAETVIRLFEDGAAEAQEWRGDLGGRLTLHEGRMRLLLDASAVSNQRDLNTLRTMLSINGHKAGFPSLHMVGIAPPVDADGEPTTVDSGPGQVAFWAVDTIAQGDGTERAASASVTQVGPVDNGSLREDAKLPREAIYRAARQYHVLALAGANLSGEAMMRAEDEFARDLLEGKSDAIDPGGRWALEVVWRLACALAGTPERAAGVRAVFECRPSAGVLSAAFREQVLKQNAAGLLSDESAMSLLGVDDLDAERGRIAAEKAEKARADLGAFFGSPDPGAPSGDGQAVPVTADEIDPTVTPTP